MWCKALNREIKVVLAPMEGITDHIMRDLLTSIGGIDLCVGEFIRITEQLLKPHTFYEYIPELKNGSKTASGVPIFVQLLGGNPTTVAENAALAASIGASGIDLNFGCPAKTVNRHDGGAALLKNPERVYHMVTAVRAAVPSAIPVTAKIRLGFSDKSRFLEIAHAAEQGGADWLTVHARTRDEGYRPPAHWEYIGQIKEALKIPVIANGEIWSVEDCERARQVSGCETVMLGRGLVAQPDLALQIQRQVARSSWLEALQWLERLVKGSVVESPSFAVARGKQFCKLLARSYLEAGPLFDVIKLEHQLEAFLLQLCRAQDINLK